MLRFVEENDRAVSPSRLARVRPVVSKHPLR